MNGSGVTVLMPVYNGERFITEAIESILDQTYENFEFLIIDDGSTDKTVNIIKSFKDKRIKLIINDENLGIAQALNKGISLAKYELIARMDADDISLPTRLQKQVNYMGVNPECVLLSCWAIEISEDKKYLTTEKFYDKHLYYNLIFQNCIYHPTVLFRKSRVLELNGYKTVFAEDYDLWCRISRKYKINNLDEPLLLYRTKPNSLLFENYTKKHDDAKDEIVLHNVEFYLKDTFLQRKKDIKDLCVSLPALIQDNRVNNLYNCFKVLNLINYKILTTDNINKNPANIDSAIRLKRYHLLKSCAQKLKFGSLIHLLWLFRSFTFFRLIILTKVKPRLGKFLIFLL